MKKTLLTMATMVAGILSMNAQCTIAPTCTPGATGYCATPASGSTLTVANIGITYNQVIQFSLGSQAAGLTGATITAVSGLPAGLSATYNPTNGVVSPSGSACMQISGITTGATGIYTMVATFKVGTVLGNTVVPAPWYIPVANSTGLNSFYNAFNGVLVLAPNPAKAELTVTSDLHLSKATIIDALGKIVLEQELNYANQATINISNLERGVYFLQANDGTKSMTKKFIKD